MAGKNGDGKEKDSAEETEADKDTTNADNTGEGGEKKGKGAELPDDPAKLKDIARDAVEQKRRANAEAADYRKRLEALEKKATEEEAKRKEAEDKELEEGKKYQSLAEKRAGEITTLKSKVGELEAQVATLTTDKTTLEGTLGKLVDAQVKALPPHVKKLLDRLSVQERYEWLAENPDAAKATKEGLPNTPDGNKGGALTDDQRKQAEQNAARTVRSNF